MLLSSLLFFLLHTYVLAACSSQCATCVNPYSYPSKARCTSCYSDYILIDHSCYSCEYCQHFDICSSCYSSSSSSTSLYAIIFGIIAGVTVVCMITIYVYYKYCKRVHPVHESAVNQQSAAELALPFNLKWKRSSNKINERQNCAICLDSNVTLLTKCGHLYHPKCIWEWCTKREFTCPLCKSYEMEPVYLHCGLCSSSQIEIRINLVPKILEEGKWNNCQYCKEQI